ncbi:DNA-binding transcriptional regulator, LysR family [Marininema mesophilum]|uniref:DNA-binding transcriptional regulator, LysR family n=1 Tax=Marininema mesophilum TaxID=1048340 RepID=A0A1H3CBS6_9BACL|nr:LysR family transcriptional regulator [Marininema mesophilum]SDX51525.1 DNA-binding transcriptional regulator, LysR family [Marininema mesophilum]
MLEMRLLEYAIEVYRQKSFTRAAAHLHISQPSLSQQVKKLEERLGVLLFHREQGGIVPTPDGMRFLEHAKNILRMRDDLEQEMSERSEGIGRELIIGAPAITGGHVLPPLLRKFAEVYPHVRVRLIEESPEKLEDLTAKGMVDISILSLPIEDPCLASQPLATEPLLLAIPPTEQKWMSEGFRALVAKRKEYRTDLEAVPLSLFAEAPFILLKKGYGFRRVVMELCAESGFQPKISFETSSIETAQSLVAHGLGVTIIPAMVVRRGSEDLTPIYLPIRPYATRTLVFVYLRDRYLSLAARALMHIHEVMKDEQ